MTVYRKRRQSQRQQQRQRQKQRRWTQRGGEGPSEGPSVSALAARFGARAGPVGSRPVGLKPVASAPVNFAGGLNYLKEHVQYNSTPNVLPPVEYPRTTLPVEAVQAGSIAEEQYQQAAEKRAANAKAKAEKNARNAVAAAEAAEAESVMAGLSNFAATPRGPWPGVVTPTGAQQASVTPSFYNMTRQQREEFAEAERQRLAGPEAPDPNQPSLLDGLSPYHYAPLREITSRTVNGRGTVKFRGGGARKKTRKPRS